MTRSLFTTPPAAAGLRTPPVRAQGAALPAAGEVEAFQAHLAEVQASAGLPATDLPCVTATPAAATAVPAQEKETSDAATTLATLMAALQGPPPTPPAAQEPAASADPKAAPSEAMVNTSGAILPPPPDLALPADAPSAPMPSPVSPLNALGVRRADSTEPGPTPERAMTEASMSKAAGTALSDQPSAAVAPVSSPPADSLAPAGAAAQPTATPARAIPPDAVPMTIASAAREGMKTFEIRLDPAELGRVDVRLSIDHEGAIRTHIVVERPETLHLLRHDSQRLDQAFSDAGLKADIPSFSLREEGGDNRRAAYAAPSGPDSGETPDDAPAPLAMPTYRAASAASRLDLMI